MPPKYPCTFCKKPVRNNRNAMLCISCYKWGHLKCSNVSDFFFRSNSDWKCDVCLWKKLPFSECSSPSFTTNNDTSRETERSNESIVSDDLDVVKNEINKLQLQKGLKLGHLNCLSLKKHIDEIRSLVNSCGMDIMTLSETHLCSDTDDSELCIPGYTILRRDRNKFGGGVANFIRNGIEFSRRNDLLQNTDIEMIITKIKLDKQKPFLVVCWYRPPNSNMKVFEEFEQVIQNIDNLKMPYHVLGNFNCDVMNSPILNHTKKTS